jgi:hypothetical protein
MQCEPKWHESSVRIYLMYLLVPLILFEAFWPSQSTQGYIAIRQTRSATTSSQKPPSPACPHTS